MSKIIISVTFIIIFSFCYRYIIFGYGDFMIVEICFYFSNLFLYVNFNPRITC